MTVEIRKVVSARDPRSIARDIPGISDALFPQLAPGVVLHFNRMSYGIESCEAIDESAVSNSQLQNAMLFEIAFAVGEQKISQERIGVDWEGAIASALRRQRNHFDAKLPTTIDENDRSISEQVGINLYKMLSSLSSVDKINASPIIPGFRWITSGTGDFSTENTLIEVKCTARRFGASDYRQILIYWLLSYAASVEGRGVEWSKAALVNPRINIMVVLDFEELIRTVAAGRTKVDVLELFRWLVGDYSGRLVEHL